MKKLRLLVRLFFLVCGGWVVGYVIYSASRGRIDNVFSGPCPDLLGFCFDHVLWNGQPYVFLFLAIFYLVFASFLVGAGVQDTPPPETEYDRQEAVRAFRRWNRSPWWLSGLVIGWLLLLIGWAIVRMH